jgi:hypothetical protein
LASAFGEKYGNADKVEEACAALVRHGYSYVAKVNVRVRVRLRVRRDEG